MNGRLSSWHRDRALQYYCVCLPVATEEENMLPISAVGLEELVGQPARPTQSASTLCTLRDFFAILETEKNTSKIVPYAT